jgi:methylmalonyl-CoA mutase N-terminal domain/subunit
VRDRFHARDDRSARFRFGVVCGGSTLHAQQPLNNAVRVAYQAMASVLGGVQSMFTAAWDEPFALPTEETTTFALRTQQILAYETGVPRTVDPLGGSYFVEALTDDMEAEIIRIMDDVEQRGGMVAAVESGYIQRLIADESHRQYQDIADGSRIVVGVNRFRTDEPPADVATYALDEEGRARQLARLDRVKSTRDQTEVKSALEDLAAAAAGTENLMPLLVRCVAGYCTVGEIVETLKGVWGEFQEPKVI